MSSEHKEQFEVLRDITVLCVEDDPIIAQTLGNILKHFVRKVWIANDGEEGFALFKEHFPDIVLTDVMMPKISGLELAKLIRKERPDTQIIISTAYDDKMFFIDAIRVGVDEYIIKPIEKEFLLQILSKAAKLQRVKRELGAVHQQRAQILDSLYEGVFGLDREGRHMFVNPSATKMLGFTQEELIGQKSDSLWRHTRRDGVPFSEEECPIFQTLHHGESYANAEGLFWRKDGSSFEAHFTTTPIWQDQELAGAVVTFWDVSERRKKDSYLRMLSLVVEQSTNMVVVTDEEGIIEYANQQFCAVSGYSTEEVMGKNPNILRSDQNDPGVYAQMWQKLKKGDHWQGELVNRRKNGEYYWVRLSVYPLKSPDELGAIRYVGLADDISETKAMEERLSQLNIQLEHRVEEEIAKNREKDRMIFEQNKMSAMGEVIKDIAHHWRQPLTAIGMLVSNIKDSFEHQELTQEYLDSSVAKVTKQLQYMSRTIDNFRNFFKPEEEKRVFDLEKTIQDSIYMVQAQLNSHGIEVAFDRQDEIPPVMGYPSEFQQVMLNMLKNSMDAIVRRNKEQHIDGKITIDMKQEEDHLVILFADNGAGIDPMIAEKIFDPYFTTKDHGKGTGIGLYMTKTIIEKAMNGTVMLLSPKEGAAFRIEIPFYREVPTADKG